MSLTESYMGLVTSQHRDKPQYTAMLDAVLQYSEDVFSCAITIDDEFDLDLAVGAQEDILGEIVAQVRTLDFQPDKGLSPILDNAAYRNLLKAKIAQNMWKGGVADLQTVWKMLFGSGIIIQDNQDMTIDIVVIGLSDQITKDMIRHGYIVPKPQSVGMNFYFADTAVFGYDMETSTVKGYDEADWMDPMPKDSFAYDMNDASKRLFGYESGYWS